MHWSCQNPGIGHFNGFSLFSFTIYIFSKAKRKINVLYTKNPKSFIVIYAKTETVNQDRQQLTSSRLHLRFRFLSVREFSIITHQQHSRMRVYIYFFFTWWSWSALPRASQPDESLTFHFSMSPSKWLEQLLALPCRTWRPKFRLKETRVTWKWHASASLDSSTNRWPRVDWPSQKAWPSHCAFEEGMNNVQPGLTPPVPGTGSIQTLC